MNHALANKLKQRMPRALIGLVLLAFSSLATATEFLRFNPFEEPALDAGLLQANANKSAGNALQLRGTVIDSDDSMVNIDGKFYRLNQEVSGYRVTRIESGSVTLQRGANETVLKIKNDE